MKEVAVRSVLLTSWPWSEKRKRDGLESAYGVSHAHSYYPALTVDQKTVIIMVVIMLLIIITILSESEYLLSQYKFIRKFVLRCSVG